MWKKACLVSELEEGKSKIASVNGKILALFKSDGAVYALDNSCPHRGGPLGDGHLEGLEVTCPWHAWTFNVKTGICETMPDIKQKTFAVKINKDEVLVDI